MTKSQKISISTYTRQLRMYRGCSALRKFISQTTLADLLWTIQGQLGTMYQYHWQTYLLRLWV